MIKRIAVYVVFTFEWWDDYVRAGLEQLRRYLEDVDTMNELHPPTA